jgi:hypothetical protein
MKEQAFLDILKIQSQSGKLLSLRKVKKDYYNYFLTSMISYNTTNPDNKVTITSSEYELLFNKNIQAGLLIKACCNSYRLNY